MATTDQINAALQKQLADLPAGINLSVGNSLASMPGVDYGSTITPPVTSLIQHLQELGAEVKGRAATDTPATIEGRRNQHWRDIADYEKWVFPLYLYLENVDWQKVMAWHEAKWSSSFSGSIWRHVRDEAGRYMGRKIFQHQLLPGTTHRIKLALPIPTPISYAHRRLDEAKTVYREYFVKKLIEEELNVPDRRRFLANQLRSAAVHLGRRERKHWGANEAWYPDWELQKALEPEETRFRGPLSGYELGKVLALVENFWQCWRAFHRAEENGTSVQEKPASPSDTLPPSLSLAHLHPAVQQAAGSLFDTNHYPHAIQAACTALEKAIQHKSGQSASVTGTALIGRAFPKDNPLLTLSADQGEREGYGFLYRGLLQAVRNHYAHNLPETSAPRALEWLSFISALFHKLDEAQPTPAP